MTNELFGASPSQLRVPAGSGLPEGGRYLGNFVLEGAEGESGGTLSRVVYYPEGSDTPVPIAGGRALYQRHCLHCHGLEGNGRGPTGYWVNPHPRDYRQGAFKFTSSAQDLGVRKPRREDLRHVIVQGIEGTSMPSFGLLPPADVDAIISYVIHLSLRGEVEYQTMKDYFKNNNQPKPLDVIEGVQTVAQCCVWNEPVEDDAVCGTLGAEPVLVDVRRAQRDRGARRRHGHAHGLCRSGIGRGTTQC